jgi:hypothetical protein
MTVVAVAVAALLSLASPSADLARPGPVAAPCEALCPAHGLCCPPWAEGTDHARVLRELTREARRDPEARAALHEYRALLWLADAFEGPRWVVERLLFWATLPWRCCVTTENARATP